MLRCIVGVLYFVGFIVRCFSLPTRLTGCLALQCVFVLVAVVVAVSVVGVRQKTPSWICPGVMSALFLVSGHFFLLTSVAEFVLVVS